MHLVGFSIEIYYDARSYKRQIRNYVKFDHSNGRNLGNHGNRNKNGNISNQRSNTCA